MASTREPQIVWKCKYSSEEVNRKNAPDVWRFAIGETKRGCPMNDSGEHYWEKK